MFRRVVICMALMAALLSGGCQDVSTRQVSGIILSCSIGFIILSWPVVILLTLLIRRLNLVRNRVVLMQYGTFVLIQIIISLSLGLLRGDFIWFIIIIVLFPLQFIPYMLIVGGLLILKLPVRLLAWVPSFLILPYYLMFALVYVTNPKWPRMDETTFYLISILSNVAVLFGIVLLVVLIIRKKRKEASRP